MAYVKKSPKKFLLLSEKLTTHLIKRAGDKTSRSYQEQNTTKEEKRIMSKMKGLSTVLDELVTCGETLISTANALKDIFSGDVETP